MNGTVETKPYCPPKGNELKNSTDKKKGQATKSRSTEVRRLRPNPKVQILKMRPNSRVSAVTWNFTSLTFGREPQTSLPRQWSIWSGTLRQPTEIYVKQTSWPRHWLPSLNHIFQQASLTRVSRVQKRTWIWSNSKRRVLTRLSIRNWGRRISTKHTCTISTTLLWVRKTSNYGRRRHWKLPPRRSRHSDTPLGT